MYAKPGTKPSGYKFVAISLEDGKRKYFMVHRLVALAFILNPDDLPEVNHKDGDKSNNNASNLEWCTHAYNSKHAVQNGFIPSGSKHPFSKLSPKQVVAIRAAIGTYRVIGKRYNISAQTVCNVKRRSKYWDVL